MRIMVDIDGVLARFEAVFLPQMGLSGDIQPNEWNWADLGVTKEMFSNGWNKFLSIENVWESLPPLPGAAELRQLYNTKALEFHKLYYVTSRPQSKGLRTENQTENWLHRNIGNHSYDVTVVGRMIEKLDFIRKYQIDAAIDDYAPIVVVGAGTMTEYWLLRQKWNRFEERAYGLRGVDSVADFFKVIGALPEMCSL